VEKSLSVFACGVRLVLGLALVASIRLSVSAQPQSVVERVAWLHGCWQGTMGQATVEEHWMAARGGTMLGMSRTILGSKTTSYELALVKEQEGRLAYEAHPSGQPSTVFVAREVADSMVVFENLQHDFPQRVGYRRTGADALAAWVEGTDKGQARRVDYSYRRTRCE
jgi:hypothetical protein